MLKSRASKGRDWPLLLGGDFEGFLDSGRVPFLKMLLFEKCDKSENFTVGEVRRDSGRINLKKKYIKHDFEFHS